MNWVIKFALLRSCQNAFYEILSQLLFGLLEITMCKILDNSDFTFLVYFLIDNRIGGFFNLILM